MRRLRITIDTGFVGAQHEDTVPLPENWDAMSLDEQERFETECIEEVITNHIDGYAEVVDD